jgi:molecular chaperone DnaK (HSP70)
VQKMVEESVAHAFEDLGARRWIEAKLKANDTLAATRKALITCAGEIESDYRIKIETAVADVEKALAIPDSEAGAGELKKLQSTVAALDEVTRPLADFLMDQAMEAMLKKRGVIQ